MMDEEEEISLLDCKTPKGQLVTLLGQKLKKPEIDDCLGEVLEKFMDLSNQQTTYLDNGIFQINFAEDALLLQSCGWLYGKMVDKLWEYLLDFHKRMVTYDESVVNNSGDCNKKKARQLELAKLEERLNRGKRKKVSLVDPQAEQKSHDDSSEGQDLFDKTDLFEDCGLEQDITFDYNFEIFNEWQDIQKTCSAEKKRQGSVLVEQYNRQQYRLKPYNLPLGNDIVYDLNDPEDFNTREGRLIGCQHIRHLFEYNDRCLLPDEDFTVAKLRLAYVLKKKWLMKNNIDANAPYNSYKQDYEKYQGDYFQFEKRKIQNLPQRTSDDLLKFYKILERKEEQAREAQMKLRKCGVRDLPDISFENLILEPLKEGYQGDYDPYIPEDVDIADGCADSSKTLETDSSIKDKLRSDSGYFDGGFEADDDSDEEENGNVRLSENITDDTGIETTECQSSSLIEKIQELSNVNRIDPNPGENGAINENTVFASTEQLSTILRSTSREERIITGDGVIEKNDNVVAIVYNKDSCTQSNLCSNSLIISLQMEKTKLPVKGILKNQEQKRKVDDKINKSHLESPKRRKLSEKQIEHLKKSLISTVKNLKFESFYSNNYQPENGEGDIQPVDYESDLDGSDYLVDREPNPAKTVHNTCGYDGNHEGSPISDNESPPSPRLLETREEPTLSFLNESHVNGNAVLDLSRDFISEISKNSGIPREELSSCNQTNEPKTRNEEEREKARERVAQWKDYITPKLKRLNENDFDIHEYGSKIIDNMAENETRNFGDLVNGKSSAEVVRYFISTLQLANTMNVEICGAKQGEISNDTFHIKLLSKERHHEHIQEYQAPSIENLKQKLEKVKQIEKNSRLHGGKSKVSNVSKPIQICPKPPSNNRKSQSFKKITVSRFQEQPSTSRQADHVDKLFESENATVKRKSNALNSPMLSSKIKRIFEFLPPLPDSSRLHETSRGSNLSRFSTDSGFMASFDDEFDSVLSSSLNQTSPKPCNILNVQRIPVSQKCPPDASWEKRDRQ
ncbi:uncharacterized protein LOC143190551 isoform X3 [Rhynchophorus ferrugineus]|uniref:uncharacterized protein LOC143190551 isoform X3 n=1 Tax=Rhynchophorus ferrugineus TaxID=354439 RepID=UPI003FCCEFD1